MSGTLYIVATPLGNLEDITYRAVRILREADLIACEDTRTTRKLLDHYSISAPLISYHEYNEDSRSEQLLSALREGKSIALVSDAGTPLIADPGYRIVHRAREQGAAVSPIPGPSAVIAALSASGLPVNSFTFHGFLPAKPTQRRKFLESFTASNETLVVYETPHRVLDALSDIEEILGARPVILARELTKIHEEFLQGTAAEIRAILVGRPGVRGEITLLIGKATAREEPQEPVEDEVKSLIGSGMPRMDAIKMVARKRGLSKRDVYRSLEKSS